MKIKATGELKLNDSPGLDVLSLHMIQSNILMYILMYYLVGQALNILGLPNVHPVVYCLSRYVLCPSIVDYAIRNSENIIDYDLTHDLKFCTITC